MNNEAHIEKMRRMQADEFDNLLNEVKAQAWDEGYVAGADPNCGSQALNPYRKGN